MGIHDSGNGDNGFADYEKWRIGEKVVFDLNKKIEMQMVQSRTKTSRVTIIKISNGTELFYQWSADGSSAGRTVVG